MSKRSLPRLPSLWTTAKIGEIADIVYGKALREQDRAGAGDIPVYASSGVVGEHNEFLHPGPSIVIGRKGTVGAICFVPGPFWCIDTAFYLDNISAAVEVEFLAHALEIIDLSRLSIVVGVPGIRRKDIEVQQIPLPLLPEQRRIVKILRQADELRQLRRQANQRARDLLPALFYEMFGDPIEPRTGWKLQYLGDFVDIASSLVDPTTGDYDEYFHVGSDNIESYTGKLIDLRRIREVGSISGKFLFSENNILYSKIRPALVKVATPDFSGLCSADIYPLTFDEGRVRKHFLAQFLRSSNFTAYTARVSGRAQIPKINREDLLKYRMVLPDVEVQEEFERHAQAILSVEKTIDESHRKFDSLFLSLVARAVTGELTAAWREANAEELREAARSATDCWGCVRKNRTRWTPPRAGS